MAGWKRTKHQPKHELRQDPYPDRLSVASDAYQHALRTLGIQCSMSRTGNCYDNAAMERFFWSLKHEWTKHESCDTLEAARLSVFNCIETFYNNQRLHQALGYQSPNQFEAEHAPTQAA